MSYQILLVDDDPVFRDEFRDSLYDYEIIEASNGAEALTFLRKPNEIDLVILDVMLPGARGTKILKDIKQLDSKLKTIILTGFGSKRVAVEALKGKADDYIEKPVNIDDAKRIIENLLAASDDGDNSQFMDAAAKIAKVKHFIERNINKKILLKDAAKAVFLSPKYLSKIFIEHTGTGFNHYRLRIKIKKAQELLRKTGSTIEQISDHLGYENAPSFTKMFKKLTGLTPTEYRNQNKSG